MGINFRKYCETASLVVRAACVLLCVMLFASDNISAQSQSYTTDDSFTVPVGVTEITVECWGAGGGGGTADGNNNYAGGAGGGAYARSVLTVSPGQNYNITIGQGGITGIDGGSTTCTGVGGTVIAVGGTGRTGTNQTAGAPGGLASACTGDVAYDGGDGGDGVGGGSKHGGAGGGGAGSTGAGGDAAGTTAGTGTADNGGDGGAGTTTVSAGNPGNVYGGGGGGAKSNNAAGPHAGGTGANGYCVISWIDPPNTITAPAATFTADDDCNWISLGDINVQEGDNDDFDGNGDYVLYLPAGFEFNTGSGSVAYTAGRDLDGASVSYVGGDLVITLTTDGTTDSQDDFTISGLQIKSTTAAVGATSLKYDFADSDDLWGAVADEVHANFTTIAKPVITGGTGTFVEGNTSKEITLADIIITETSNGNFRDAQTTDTYIIDCPAGFVFVENSGEGSESVTGSEVSITDFQVSTSDITITMTTTGDVENNVITLSGIQAKVTTATNAGGPDYYLTYDCASSSGIWGVADNETHGTLTVNGPNVITTSDDNIVLDNCKYRIIPDIVITEGAVTNFENGQTGDYVLDAPAGVEFEAGTGSASESGSDVTVNSTTVISDKVTVNVSIGGTATVDAITISGLKMIETSAGAGAHTITHNNTDSDDIFGAAPGATHGTITVVSVTTVTDGTASFNVGDPTPETLTDIVIDETHASGFLTGQTNETIRITAPAGFEFEDPNSGSASATGGTDISAVGAISVGPGGSYIEFQITTTAEAAVDQITVTGVDLHITTASASTYYLDFDCNNSSGDWGIIDGTDCGTLTATSAPNTITKPAATFTADDDCNWISLGDINVQEAINSNFNGDGDYVLYLPAGFEFNTGVGSVAYTAARDLDGASLSYVAGDLVITLSTDGSTDSQDDFTISGLQIKSTTAAVGATSLKYDFADSDDLWGAVADEVHADFTTIAKPVITGGTGTFVEDNTSKEITLTDIIITETSNGNFRDAQTTETYIIDCPAGFEFVENSGEGSESVTGSEVSITDFQVSTSDITITMTTTGDVENNVITLSGIQAKVTTATNAGGPDYYLTYDCTSSSGNWGVADNATHGTLTVNPSNVITTSDDNIALDDCKYRVIPDIVITEGAATNFENGRTGDYVLDAPAGVEFEAGTGSASETGNDVTVNSTLVTADKVTVNVTIGGTATVDAITISGLKMIETTAGAGAHTITHDNTDSDDMFGAAPGATHGTITVVSVTTVTDGTASFNVGDPTPETLTDIVIDETHASGFLTGQTNETIRITAPAGFEFEDPNSGSASATGGTDISAVGAISVGPGGSYIEFQVTTTAEAAVDQITVTGVDLHITTASAGTYYLDFDCNNSSGDWGITDGTDCGTLTAVVSNTFTTGSATVAVDACKYRTVSDIVITEGATNNFTPSQAGKTYVIIPPAGNEFKDYVADAGPTVTATVGTDITIDSYDVDADRLTITITTDGTADAPLDQITISGLEITETTAGVGGPYNITYSSALSNGSFSTLDGDVHGSVTVVAKPTVSGGNGTFYEDRTYPVTLTDIVINEMTDGNFAGGQSGVTYIITPPAGFEFVDASQSASETGDDITINSLVVATGSVTLNIDVGGETTADQITISDIEVTNTGGTVAGSPYNPVYDCGTSTADLGLESSIVNGIFTVNTATSTVTPSDNELTIDACYSAIGDIVITENNTDEAFAISQTDETIVLSPPAGTEFEAGTGNVSGAAGDISATSINVLAGSATVTFSTDGVPDNNDAITISGLRMIETTAGLGGPINITLDAGSTGKIGVASGTTLGSLTVINFATVSTTSDNFTEGDPTPVAMNDIVISEVNAKNFRDGQANKTLRINAPAGFTFTDNAPAASASATAGTDVTINTTTVNANYIELDITTTGEATIDEITIEDVDVVLGAATSGSYYPTFDCTNSTGDWGIKDGTNCATFIVTGSSNTITKGNAVIAAAGCFVTISDINVEESANTNFQASQTDKTYVLVPSDAGLEFNPGVGTVSYSSGNDISSSPTINVTAGAVEVTISTDGTADATDDFTISGVQIKDVSAGTGSYTLQYDASSTGYWSTTAGENNADITVISPSTVNDPAASFAEGSDVPVAIPDIVISESGNNGFMFSQTDLTYVISPPAGFEWAAGEGSVAVTSGTTDITASSITVTTGAITLTLSTDATSDQADELTVSGVSARNMSATAGTYNPTFSCSSSTGFWAMTDGTNHGTFTVSAPIVSAQTGNWNTGTTWVGGSVPGASDHAKILAAHSVYVDNGTAPSVTSLIIEGILEWDQQNKTVTVSGNLSVSGGMDATAAGDYSAANGANVNVGGNCSFDGGYYHPRPGGSGGTLDITGNLLCTGSDVELCDAASNSNQSVIVGGDFAISSGKTIVGGCNMTVNGTSAIDGELEYATSDAGAKIFKDDITISATGTWDNTIGADPFLNGDLTNNGSWIGLPPGAECNYTFGNEIAGTYTVTGNPIAVTTLEVSAATTVINTGTISIELDDATTPLLLGAGTFTNGDGGKLYVGDGTTDRTADEVTITTFNATTEGNFVYFQKSANQIISQPSDGYYYNLVCGNSGTKSLGDATVTIENLLTIQDAAVVNVSTNTLDGNGGLTMTGTSDLQIAKIATVPELTGTYTLTAGTVTLNGADAQTYNSAPSGASTCYNMILGNNGAKTIDGLTIINGDFTVSGTATISSHSSFTQASAKTFYYNSSSATTLTAATNITIGNYSQSAGELIDNGITITVNGTSWAKSGGTFTATGTAAFNNAAGTEVSGVSMTTFNNITINSGKILKGHSTDMGLIGTFYNNSATYIHNDGEVTMSGSAAITGSETTFYDVELSGGTITGHGTNVNIERNWTNSGGTFDPNNGTVTFTGTEATQTITVSGSGMETFYGLTVDKSSGALTVGGGGDATDVRVTNLLTIADGTFDMNTQTLDGTGGLTMAVGTDGDLQMAILSTSTPALTGTYTLQGGIITLDGAGDQILRPSENYYNLLFTTSGVKTLTSVATINGDVTVSGTATLTGAAFTQASGKTFYYNSTGGTTTLTSGVTVGSYSQDGAGGTLNINGNTLTVTGSSWTYSNGTFTPSGKVLFQGGSAQSFTGATTFNDCEIDNSNGLTLNDNITVNGTLTFTSGNITTDVNNVIIANGGSVSRTSGHVDGNLQKWVSSASSSPTYEIGTGSDYTPIDFTFATVNTDGYLTCYSTASQHPSIFASTIDPDKCVNRYWTMSVPGGFDFTTYDATFNFIDPDDVDGGADWNGFQVHRYDGVNWHTTSTGSVTLTSTEMTGHSSVVTDFTIGETVVTVAVYTRVIGSADWSDPATWIQYRTGTVQFTNGSDQVTGGGTTLFTTELEVDDVIMLQSTPGVVRGTVKSIEDDDNLTLYADPGVDISGSYGRQSVPTVTDIITNIGNPNLTTGAVNVVLDVDATIFGLAFPAMDFSNTLTHNSGKDLTLNSNVMIYQPSNANTNSWNINDGSATLAGILYIGSNDVNTDRIAEVVITTGTLSIGTGVNFYSTAGAGQEVSAVMDLSGGTATVNLSGSFTLQNGTGTITPGASSTFNYNGTTVAQTIGFGSAVVYNNLHLNNTHSNGVTPGAAITTSNVTGNLKVLSGKFINGGYAITGNGGKIFEVEDGATFEMTGTAVFPTGFGTYTFGTSSTTEYHQTDDQTISDQDYGNLEVEPSTDGRTHTFAAGTPSVAGNFIAGNGTNTGITVTAAPNATTLDVTENINISNNTTFVANAANTMSISGDWVLNGSFTHSSGTIDFNNTTGGQQIKGTAASQTFNDIEIDKTAQTLSLGGSTTTLSVNDLTLTSGDFTAPATLNIGGTLTLTSGELTAGTTINASGDWTNNGGTFTHNNGTVVFDNTVADQTINGTAASQTFYNVSLENDGTVLSTGGSTATLTFNDLDFTVDAGTFTAPATMNIEGNLSMTDGTYTGGATTNITGDFSMTNGTFTAGTNTNFSGDLDYDGGTFTHGANTITLNGSSDQTIDGSVSWPDFNNLTINNTSGTGDEITLNKPITVDGTLTLTDGNIVTTETNILAMGASAPDISGGSDASFIKGPMQHTVNTTASTTKIFICGLGSSMHKTELTVTQSAATATNYSCEYSSDSPEDLGWSLPGTIEYVSDIGGWVIEKGAGSAVTYASVKLYYLESDEVTDPPNLRIAKGNPNAWTDIGGTGSGTPTGSITSDINFTTFSRFVFANRSGGSNPLPVELIDFSANLSGDMVDLTWTTASETNNDYFTVEKTADFDNYEVVTIVPGAGNSSGMLNYLATDYDPYEGISYYRLKQTDFNGDFEYSQHVSVDFIINTVSYARNPVFNVYPNPARDGTNIYVSLEKFVQDSEVLIVVHNIMGAILYSKVIITDSQGDAIVAIDINNRLSPGIYLIIGTSNDQYYSKKLIIK